MKNELDLDLVKNKMLDAGIEHLSFLNASCVSKIIFTNFLFTNFMLNLSDGSRENRRSEQKSRSSDRPETRKFQSTTFFVTILTN